MAVSKKSNQTQAEKQSRVPARGNRSQPEVIAYWRENWKKLIKIGKIGK